MHHSTTTLNVYFKSPHTSKYNTHCSQKDKTANKNGYKNATNSTNKINLLTVEQAQSRQRRSLLLIGSSMF